MDEPEGRSGPELADGEGTPTSEEGEPTADATGVSVGASADGTTTEPSADGAVAERTDGVASEGVDASNVDAPVADTSTSDAPAPNALAGEFVAPHPDAATVAGRTVDAQSVAEAPARGVDGRSVSTAAEEAELDADQDGSEEDDGLFDGPPSDQEMPLADHIDEMMRRLTVVVAVVGVVMVFVFPLADQVINFLWNAHIPGAATIENRRPRLYGPLELILTEIKVAGLAGFVIGLPVFVYETYKFMRPGLYQQERRYYLAAVPTSLVLALVGVAFAHLVVLPAIFAYFTSYTLGTAVVAFGLQETFRLILLLMGYMAVVFQIPLFMMLAIMMNLVTRLWFTDKRLLFWGAFLGISFLVSPDPTGMAPIIVAATMIVLFEGTLFLLRWTGN